ncbi:conserved phage C-terminal domain-containing protein [Levilactobacillus brevis]|uniref:conserved phage C-terminal domain-containing protein n=1 Tax=Levilactobacillus brevis TaxID=1580 RepID=UPI000B3ED3B2|nr:conserved phage C-terminal domain-containing protein [Levilactobacillus brevis]ARW21839.1 hypothetical protein S101174_00996 [Levilactobacillus brevis]
MQGWVKLYRELLDKPIWLLSTSNQRSILIAILLLANHSENKWEWKGKPFVVKPGQFITSADSLAKKSGRGITRQAVRGAMQRFTKLGFITSEATNTNTLINVVNWGSFQVKENETTSETTNEQPSDNQRTTTNKNDKNDKKKDKSKEPAVDYKKIVDYLNSETGHKYHTTDKTRGMIHARIAEGFTEHDFGMVIHYKSLEWKDNPDMQQYLRPKTLFSAEHFDDYTNEARAAASKQQRQDTSEPPVLTPEEGSARQADYMARLEKQYAKEGESNE